MTEIWIVDKDGIASKVKSFQHYLHETGAPCSLQFFVEPLPDEVPEWGFGDSQILLGGLEKHQLYEAIERCSREAKEGEILLVTYGDRLSCEVMPRSKFQSRYSTKPKEKAEKG